MQDFTLLQTAAGIFKEEMYAQSSGMHHCWLSYQIRYITFQLYFSSQF